MTGRTHHFNDDDLLACYYAERGGEACEAAKARHLIECQACAARYAECAHVLDLVRKEGDVDTAGLFSPERLRHQQEHIRGRLEHLGRAARIISFPNPMGRGIAAATTRVTARWLGAAAAAGVFVGVAVGGMFFEGGPRRSGSSQTPVIVSSPQRFAPSVLAVPASTAWESSDDDAFLLDLELALERPGTRELLPFEALTPHVREISSQTALGRD